MTLYSPVISCHADASWRGQTHSFLDTIVLIWWPWAIRVLLSCHGFYNPISSVTSEQQNTNWHGQTDCFHGTLLISKLGDDSEHGQTNSLLEHCSYVTLGYHDASWYGFYYPIFFCDLRAAEYKLSRSNRLFSWHFVLLWFHGKGTWHWDITMLVVRVRHIIFVTLCSVISGKLELS